MDGPEKAPVSASSGASARSTGLTAGLAVILEQARMIADEEEAKEVDRVLTRVADCRLRVMVVGEAKRGKSSLINALLGRPLLPTGVVPVTAVTTTTTITAGGPPAGQAIVTGLDGSHEVVDLDRLADFVTEHGNPGNARRVAEVTILVSVPSVWSFPVDLVDTPGIGSVHRHNTEDANRVLPTLDAAILVLGIDPPLTLAERELLDQVRELAVRVFVIVNKTDRHSPEEVAEALEYTRAVGGFEEDVTILACSARQAWDDPGFRAVASALHHYLTAAADSDAARALHGHALRVVEAMTQRRQVSVAVAELTATGQQHRIVSLRERLRALGEQGDQVSDRCATGLTRLRRALDQAATDATPAVAKRVTGRLENLWRDELSMLPVPDARERGLAAVDRLVTDEVEAWRREESKTIVTGLARIASDAERDIAAQAALARADISRTLDITLPATTETLELAPSDRFRYDYHRTPGWEPPLAGTLTRIGRRDRRRRRVRDALHADVPVMSDRQLGRARSDLANRLARSSRELSTAVHARYAVAVALFERQLSLAMAAWETDPVSRAELERQIRVLNALRDRVLRQSPP